MSDITQAMLDEPVPQKQQKEIITMRDEDGFVIVEKS